MSQVTPASVDREYNKHDVNISSEEIQLLRKWIESQPHLPNKHITDLELILAYYVCECNLERSKELIDLNYTLRSLFVFYKNRKIDKSLEISFESWLVTPLTTPTKKGYHPIYCQLLDPDINKFVYEEVVRAFVMIVDLFLYEEGTVPGIALIINLDRVNLDHISRVNLLVAQQFFYFLQEAMFVRLKEFHFINAPTFIDKLLSLFKPFMKENLLDMLHVHRAGSNTLNEFLPTIALPKDAGGQTLDSTVLRDLMWEKLKANEIFFKKESKRRVDERKRVGKPKTISTFFPNLEGSFKHLQID